MTNVVVAQREVRLEPCAGALGVRMCTANPW